jgi:hypothetical protein
VIEPTTLFASGADEGANDRRREEGRGSRRRPEDDPERAGARALPPVRPDLAVGAVPPELRALPGVVLRDGRDLCFGRELQHVRGQVGELRPGERIAVLTPVLRVAAAALHAQQLAAPSSNSWLPTELTDRLSAFIASTEGSSWNSPEISGEAPIRSPPATTSELGFCAIACLIRVARYSTPPAGTPLISPLDPDGGSRSRGSR